MTGAPPPKWVDERYTAAKLKLRRQRRELRLLNRAIRIEQLVHHESMGHYYRQVDMLRKRLETPVDYRSVCQCWTCRLREWWRFRRGLTYPGEAGLALSVTPWPEQLVDAAHARLLALPETHDARAYLLGRGVTAADLVDHRVGWIEAPQLETCTPVFWDWFKRYGWDRICFPLTDPFGQVIGVQLRSLRDKSYMRYDFQPSELCPPVFGLHVGLPAAFLSRRMVVVEGIFDYFAVRRTGTPDVVAVLTNSAGPGVRRLLSRYVDTVVCLFDMDRPGRRGAYRLAGLNPPAEYRLPKDSPSPTLATPPYLVTIPFYSEHDPADLWSHDKQDELRYLVRQIFSPPAGSSAPIS